MFFQARKILKTIRALGQAILSIAVATLVGCGGGGGGGGAVTTTQGKWTILVYMNAANDLDAYSTLNILQMQQAATNPDVRIIVQWKQVTSLSPSASFNGTRRYLIKPSSAGVVSSQLVDNMGSGVDMGLPQTLNNFIVWGKTHYPADHTAVVLWDHGNGWLPSIKGAKPGPPPAFSYDDQTGHAIQIWQLNQAFAGQHVDITAFDASLMQMDEVAYQLIGLTDYVAGSEESPPGAGYPYQRVLAEFDANPTETPRLLSKAFVDAMVDEPTYDNQKIEQSVIDTSQMAAVALAAQGLQQALVANESALTTIVPNLRTTVQSYLQTTNRYFFDSIDLSNQLSAATTIPSLQSACASYLSAASSAIVWEGHNSLSPGSHGISIDFSPSSFFSTVSADYKLLAWNSATEWNQWLSIAP